MSDPFSDPGAPTGDKLPLDELIGSLLLFDVKEQVKEIVTPHGLATPIRCDVAVLDGALKGGTYPNAFVFGVVLQGQLRDKIGGKVLGRLGQGPKQPGKSPPWTLTASTDADKEVGRKYLVDAATKVAAESEPF